MDEVKVAALDVVVRAAAGVVDVEQLVKDARVVEAYLREGEQEVLQAIKRLDEQQRANQAAAQRNMEAAVRMTGRARP